MMIKVKKEIGGLNGEGAEREGCRRAYEERKLTLKPFGSHKEANCYRSFPK